MDFVNTSHLLPTRHPKMTRALGLDVLVLLSQ